MSVASWTAALRIARREAWRGKLRSVLVIALVGLPVFVLAGADVLYRTWQLSPQQEITRTMGHADARVQWLGLVGLQQTPDPDNGAIGGSAPTPVITRPDKGSVGPTTAEVASHLPRGSRLIEERTGAPVSFYTRSGLAEASITGLDYADPIAAGMLRQVGGRAPRADDEVALTTALASDTGLGVGDTMHAVDPKRTLKIVGLVDERANQNDRSIYALPGAIPQTGSTEFGNEPTWLVDTPQPVTWADVKHLDTLGFVTLSRQVFLDPPPSSAQTLVPGNDRSVSAHAIATGTLVAGMVLLEIVLLAGPAFTVGAHRRRRDLGLLAAVGGGRADLRRVVLADAIVLGAAAGVAAAAAGIGVGALAEPLVEHFVDPLPGPFDVPLLELGALILVSIATALLAALIPAVRAARADVVAALAGRRGVVRTRARVPIIGAAIAATGVAVTLGVFGAASASSVLLGVALVEIGLITASPAVIGLVARAARWLPVSGRIALRDASRNRASAAPAVAAVMATVIGAMAAAIGTASAQAQQRDQYTALLPQRDAYVDLRSHPADAGPVVAAMRKALPGAPTTVIRTVRSNCDLSAGGTATPGSCTGIELQQPTGPVRERWHSSDLPALVVDDGTGVDALFGRHEPQAAAALRAGRVVVLDGAAVHRGHVSIRTSRVEQQSDGSQVEQILHTVSAPATVIGTGFGGVQLIVPPSVAEQLGTAIDPVGVLGSTDRVVTPQQRQALAAGLQRIGDRLNVHTESGYSDPALWLPLLMVGGAGVVAVFAALIATALANVDGRADLTLLASVGAAPRTRRVLSFARAAVIAGIGTVIGALAGVLPARAWVQSVGAPVVIPWTAVLVAVIGIPALAGGLAWLFTRARLPSERPA